VKVGALYSSTMVRCKVAGLDEVTSGMSASCDKDEEDEEDVASWHTYE